MIILLKLVSCLQDDDAKMARKLQEEENSGGRRTRQPKKKTPVKKEGGGGGPRKGNDQFLDMKHKVFTVNAQVLPSNPHVWNESQWTR